MHIVIYITKACVALRQTSEMLCACFGSFPRQIESLHLGMRYLEIMINIVFSIFILIAAVLQFPWPLQIFFVLSISFAVLPNNGNIENWKFLRPDIKNDNLRKVHPIVTAHRFGASRNASIALEACAIAKRIC